MRSKSIKHVIITSWTIITIIALCISFSSCIAGKREAVPSISKYLEMSPQDRDTPVTEKAILKIMTLNIAHGRRDGPSQFFQGKKSIKSNLDEIALVLKRESPDLVALQEADGPSSWSGNFNHVAYLAEKAGYVYSIQGAHVKGATLSYGTAILSKYPLINPISITFEPAPPTFPKGFVSAVFQCFSEQGYKIRVVSVHFDFSRHGVRLDQAQEMIKTLSADKNPMIVMGDFNSQYTDKSSIMPMISETLGLKAFQEDADHLNTFPFSDKRWDWILISKELEFVTYRLIPDILSDHLGVIAEIRRTN